MKMNVLWICFLLFSKTLLSMELQSQNQNKIDWRVTIMALNTDGLGIVDEQRELDGRDWINTVLHVFGTWINIGQANPIVMIEIEKEDKEQRTVPLYFLPIRRESPKYSRQCQFNLFDETLFYDPVLIFHRLHPAGEISFAPLNVKLFCYPTAGNNAFVLRIEPHIADRSKGQELTVPLV
ncbi:hypothetical protein IPH25_01650 [bacterium]|nr:MAG: hypothetical protein IPG37_03780 [bacterium]QQR62131.1 MAG: hypothetical protein IPH25_01650 [bacterium]QQR63311.1 MAG: hypothetical protein IPH67_02460 [bacterium]